MGGIFPWFPIPPSTLIYCWLIEAIQFPLSSIYDVTGGHFAGDEVRDVICESNTVDEKGYLDSKSRVNLRFVRL